MMMNSHIVEDIIISYSSS